MGVGEMATQFDVTDYMVSCGSNWCQNLLDVIVYIVMYIEKTTLDFFACKEKM